jgi:hypothetical protein
MARFKVTVEQPPETEEFAVDIELRRVAGYWRVTYYSVPLLKRSPRDFTNAEEMLRDLLKRNGYLVRRIEELPSA